MYTDTAHRHKFAYLNGSLYIKFMCGILEYFYDVLIVGTFGSSGKSQREFRLEICKDLLICICRSVMSFIYNKILELVLTKHFEVQRNTLDTSADDKSVFLLYGISELTNRNAFPQSIESFISLIYKLYRMCEEQCAFAEPLCIADCGNGLSRSCCVIKKCDSFMTFAHFFK